jgi:hypothetical protein
MGAKHFNSKCTIESTMQLLFKSDDSILFVWIPFYVLAAGFFLYPAVNLSSFSVHEVFWMLRIVGGKLLLFEKASSWSTWTVHGVVMSRFV